MYDSATSDKQMRWAIKFSNFRNKSTRWFKGIRPAHGAVYTRDFHGSQVAVKEYRGIIKSQHNLRILQREEYIASQCRYLNLLQFICATRNDQNRLLIVTELMGMTLRTLTERHARDRSWLEYEEIRLISLDVACGLNYLHSIKPSPVVHRDISSANVLLHIGNRSPRRAKISVYGSANFMVMSTAPNPGAAPVKIDLNDIRVGLLSCCSPSCAVVRIWYLCPMSHFRVSSWRAIFHRVCF